MAILSYLRGGDAPYTKKYVSNVRTEINRENGKGDMLQVLEYFRNKQKEDPNFYYAFKVADEDINKVLCLSWADGYSRKMYELYGDCLSFGTTYKTNCYNMPICTICWHHSTRAPLSTPPPTTKQRSSCNHVGGHANLVGCRACSCGDVVGLANGPSPLSEQKSPLAVGLQDMQLQMGHDNQSCVPGCIHATPHPPTHKTTHSCITRQYLQLHG